MKRTSRELKGLLEYEKTIYKELGYKNEFITFLLRSEIGMIWRYIKYLRLEEYYLDKIENKLFYILYLINKRKKNKLGVMLGISIPPNTVGKGIIIYHSGDIIINKNAKLGENCKLHGDNCIGNNGITEYAPIIGNNVDIGVGAKVIGNIILGDNCKIGANSVITKSFKQKNLILVGIPAKIMKNKNN